MAEIQSCCRDTIKHANRRPIQNKAPSLSPSEPDSESDEAQDREEEDTEVDEVMERIENGQGLQRLIIKMSRHNKAPSLTPSELDSESDDAQDREEEDTEVDEVMERIENGQGLQRLIIKMSLCLTRHNKAPSLTPSEPDSGSDEAQDREEEDTEVDEVMERIENGQGLQRLIIKMSRHNKAPSLTPSEPDSESDDAQDREEEDTEVDEVMERIENGQGLQRLIIKMSTLDGPIVRDMGVQGSSQ
ncbi:myosin heavy chain, skeletal muscle-like [Ptychodera flava]|uniref:myosin heavy chain, skeletal muscle-like n=1 Tax=Ptychodera flava TaxID=63121 RepID=UPI00396A7106